VGLVAIRRRIWRPIYAKTQPIIKSFRRWRISKFSQSETEAEQSERFKVLGLDWRESRKGVEKLLGKNLDIFSHRSEHYELLFAISQVHKPKRILEIGTATGDFSVFLATIFPDAKIETIDLSRLDNRFWNATSDLVTTNDWAVSKTDLEERDARLSSFSNIEFRELNSLALTFQESKKYDLIWVDGDHTYPVVSVDIANALRLLEIGGILVADDIYEVTQKRRESGNQESHETLVQFKKAGFIDFNLVLKRLFPEPYYNKRSQKFIAVATRKNNPDTF
jgi:predicted O-methyltransferase YrrM